MLARHTPETDGCSTSRMIPTAPRPCAQPAGRASPPRRRLSRRRGTACSGWPGRPGPPARRSWRSGRPGSSCPGRRRRAERRRSSDRLRSWGRGRGRRNRTGRVRLCLLCMVQLSLHLDRRISSVWQSLPPACPPSPGTRTTTSSSPGPSLASGQGQHQHKLNLFAS